MRPSRPLTPLAGLVLLLLVARAVPYAAPEPARCGLANAQHPYLGVTLISRVVTSPRLARLHVAQVDLRAPGVQIALTPPAGGREVVRERTVDALVQANAQLAVNGHFFLPFPSDDAEAWVVGLAATDGRVFSDFEIPEQSYALVAHAPALNLDRRNRARIVHHRAGRNGRRVRERVTLWNAVAGSAQIVTGGRVTIPTYRDDTHPRGLLTPGPDGRYSNARSWYDVVTSRTVCGALAESTDPDAGGGGGSRGHRRSYGGRACHATGARLRRVGRHQPRWRRVHDDGMDRPGHGAAGVVEHVVGQSFRPAGGQQPAGVCASHGAVAWPFELRGTPGRGASVTVTTGGRLNPPPLRTSSVIEPMNHEAAHAAHWPVESIPCAASGLR